MCKLDAGMDGDASDCLTECASATDLTTHHLDDGFRYFAHDEAFNEKDGNKIREKHNEAAPKEVPQCAPMPGYEAGTTPTFKQLDVNGDGVINEYEALDFSAKACIPDEMVFQIFAEADSNKDKLIEKSEWKEGAGEETVNEKAMDDALEDVSEGDDEYNPVQNPPFVEFDKNDDGALDKKEQHDMFEHEIDRRTEHADIPAEKKEEIEPKIQEAVDKVDTNDDGLISPDEYAKETPAEGMGEELKEAGEAKNDEEELDDLPRADGTKPPAFIATRRALRHGRQLQ